MTYNKHDIYFMSVALLTAQNSTCSRLATGAVIVSEHGTIIGVGYNGAGRGLVHCKCVNKEKITPCRCIHAEQNCIVNANEAFHTKKKAYLTDTPCYSCMKLLVAYGIKEIYYFRRYRDDLKSFELAEEARIEMINIPEFFQVEVPEVN